MGAMTKYIPFLRDRQFLTIKCRIYQKQIDQAGERWLELYKKSLRKDSEIERLRGQILVLEDDLAYYKGWISRHVEKRIAEKESVSQ